MCQYIKDNGEQCGRTAEPFCHDHDGSAQAKLWLRLDDLYEEMEELTQKVLSGAQNDSSDRTMETTCGECGSSLRRRERLTSHPHQPRRMVFEAYVECDCGEHVLGATSVRKADAPSGWSE